jgi:hypothetical protein
MNNDQTGTTEAKCCIDFCSINFEVSGEQVPNNYKCNEKDFSSADLWKIQKSRREFTRRTSNFAIN